MGPEEFVGRHGSRKEAVQRVLRFLDESAPGYLIVYGTWAIGKSRVIEKALAERPEIYEVMRSRDYVKLNLGELLAMIDDHRSKRRRSRFEDPGSDYLSKVIEGLERKLGQQKQVVFWVSVSHVEDDHTALADLLLSHGKSYSGPPRKFIFELRRVQSIRLGGNNVMNRRTLRVEGFYECELEEYLRCCLGESLGLSIAARSQVIGRQACRIFGRHPGLLQVLCETIGEASEERLASMRNLSPEGLDSSFHELAMDLIDISEPVWKDCIRDVVATLSSRARMALREQRVHSELEVDGLAFKNGDRIELTFLLSRFGAAVDDALGADPAQGMSRPPSEGKGKSSIFISYDSRDSGIAHRIEKGLRDHGMDVWISTRMRVGDPIPGRVFQAISNVDFFVVIWSKHAVESRWVKEEINAALMHAISRQERYSILPVITDDLPLPEPLGSRLGADFRGRYKSGLAELLRAIQEIGDQQVA